MSMNKPNGMNGLRRIALLLLVAVRAQGFSVAPGGAQPEHILDCRHIKNAVLFNGWRSSCRASPRKADCRRWPLLSKRHDGADDELSSSLLNVLLTPTPGIPDSLALVVPLVAVLYAIIVDPSVAFMTTILFALLRTVAIRLVLFPQLPDTADVIPATLSEQTDQEEEDERNRIERLQLDVFCAGIAATTVLIIGPDFYAVVIVASIATIVLLLATVKDIVDEEQLNQDDKLLNRWDKRFRKQMINNNDDDETDRKSGVK
jgi:hypothetical protein